MNSMIFKVNVIYGPSFNIYNYVILSHLNDLR